GYRCGMRPAPQQTDQKSEQNGIIEPAPYFGFYPKRGGLFTFKKTNKQGRYRVQQLYAEKIF
ncbi:hypothetical protein LI095_10390, partial [Veillonella atypica]|uniref:hypothetical protein n=1 Tax=Veillonella atypica TaxID=39777 RepID=UPI001D08A51B